MRPQTQFCFAQGCKVQLWDERGNSMPGSGELFSHGIERSFCHEHGELWIEVERDLPLAIEELHALALLYPDFWKVHVGPEDHDLREWVRHAEERVRKLRELETLLKGDG